MRFTSNQGCGIREVAGEWAVRTWHKRPFKAHGGHETSIAGSRIVQQITGFCKAAPAANSSRRQIKPFFSRRDEGCCLGKKSLRRDSSCMIVLYQLTIEDTGGTSPAHRPSSEKGGKHR